MPLSHTGLGEFPREHEKMRKNDAHEKLIAVYSDLKGSREVGFCHLSKVTSERTRGNGLKLHQAWFKLHISKKFLHQRGGHALQEAAQGSGRIIIPGDI